MGTMSQEDDIANESNNNFTSDESVNPELIIEQVKNIAECGNVDIVWPELQKTLKLRLENVLELYLQSGDDTKSEQYQEPNVEKFNLESSREEILELIASFNEAPFTIQRICELLYSPLKYYDRIGTFLRGLEKNLRVISSHNWPKMSQCETTKSDEDINVMTPPDQPISNEVQPVIAETEPEPGIDKEVEQASDEQATNNGESTLSNIPGL